MPLDPAILKARWGVTDPALDLLVADVAETAQALAESYTGRRFDLDDDAQDFEQVTYSFQVRRYPIESISAMWHWQNGQVPNDLPAGTGISAYRFDRDKGLVWPGVSPCVWPGLLHVEYRGGYAKWPADLNWAVINIADIIWADTPGGGAPAGSPGGAMGQVKKLSVVGVYTAELDTGGDASGGSDGDNTWGIVPPSATAVLDRYRLAAVIGIG